MAVLVALAHRDEPGRVDVVIDLVRAGVVREARVGEGGTAAAERGERRLGGGDEPVTLGEPGGQEGHQPAAALRPDGHLDRPLDRRGEVVDGQGAGVT